MTEERRIAALALIGLGLHGIRALRVEPAGTRIELPKFRDAGGTLRTAIILPDEKEARSAMVLDALIERGIARRRFAVPIPAA